MVNRVKLIAEPWDVGEGGYQVGNFPALWSEWNGRYRDGVRDYWRGADQSLAEFASRLTGSSDLYAWSGRRPSASINFVTAHDGFTLADLVAYDHKHNDANGEDNRDGENHNRSWNSGVEGPTDDPAVLHVRDVRRRSLLATLLLSQGVPMLLGGDEIGRSQGGNNNGYCQDNEISWYDWGAVDTQLHAFVRRLIRLRRTHPIFRRRRWFEGRAIHGAEVEDICWFTPEGVEMADSDWQVGYRALVRGAPERRRDPDPRSARRADPRRHVHPAVQRARRAGHVHDPRPRERFALDGRARHEDDRDPRYGAVGVGHLAGRGVGGRATPSRRVTGPWCQVPAPIPR